MMIVTTVLRVVLPSTSSITSSSGPTKSHSELKAWTNFIKMKCFYICQLCVEVKIHFQNLKMVAGSTSSCLCRIICVFFCTSVAKSANDGRSLKKAIFVFDIPGEKERTKTFYTQWKNFFL